MFDANKILGMLMESGISRSGQSRVQRMAGGSQAGGGLAGIAGALLGGGGSQGGGGLAGIAGALLGGRGAGAGLGGGLGGIAGSLLGGGAGRSAMSGGAMSGGAMGLLGTLAGVAMQHFGSGQGAGQASEQPGLAEDAEPYAGDSPSLDDNTRAMVMIRAMISAAKADGEIDPQERERILSRIEEAGEDADAKAFVQAELARPVDVSAIVSAVDTPHTALEVYAASLFAIDVDTPAEAAYMRQLAQGLKLDPTLVRSLHETLEAPQPH